METKKRSIAPSQIENYNQSSQAANDWTNVVFPGMAGYGHPWICVYVIKAAPHRGIIRAAGSTKSFADSFWTVEAEGAF